jgi:hypothetical protein
MNRVFVLAAVSLIVLTSQLGFAEPGTWRSMWVWTDEVTDPVKRQALVDRAYESCITRLYISVYKFPPNSHGDRMYERADIGTLIALAHAKGIEVWTAYGNSDWPGLAADFNCNCMPSGFVWDRVDEYNNFNSDPNYENFDGWMFDVEPSPLDRRVLAMYACTRSRLDPASALGAVIQNFWHMPAVPDTEYPCGSGINKPIYQHAIDLSVLDVIVPLCYRDSVSGNNGILDICEEELTYAEKQDQGDVLEIGLETSCDVAANITFCQEGASAMRCAISQLRSLFTVRGFSLHQYGGSISRGTAAWPEYDPSACEVETLMLSKQGPLAEISWPPVPPAVAYDVIIDDDGMTFPVVCGTTNLSATDGTIASPGQVLFYVQRLHTQNAVGNYGISSSCILRDDGGACP